MPLETKIIDVPLFTGVDSKTEEKSVQNKLLVLENAVMQHTGEIQKRNGYEALALGTTNNVGLVADDELIGGNSIHSYGKQLILVGKDGGTAGENSQKGPHIFSFGDDFNKHFTAGNYDPVTFTIERISKPDQEHSQASHAEGNGLRMFVYNYSGHCESDIVGATDGINYRERLIINNVAESPQVAYLEDGYGKNFLALGMATVSSGTRTIDGRYFDTTTPGEQGTAVTIAGTSAELSYDQLWDMDVVPYAAHTAGDNSGGGGGVETSDGGAIDGYQQAWIVWKRESNQILQMAALDGHGNVHKSLLPGVDGSGNYGIQPKGAVCLKYINDPGGMGERIFLIYQDKATGNIDGYAFNPDMTQCIAQTTINTSLTSDTISNITLAADPQSGSGHIRIFVEVTTGVAEDYRSVYSFLRNWDLGSGSSGTREQFHVGLASKAFTYGERAYVLTVHDSGLQATYFLNTRREGSDHMTAAKIFYGRAGGVRQHGLANVVQRSASEFSIACTVQSRILSDALRDYQVACINFELNPPALQAVQMGTTLVIGGGYISGFDRLNQELGFHLYPENITLDSGGPSDTGGAMGDGYRSYRAVYAWTDHNGEIYRSAPSEAIGRTYVLATDTQSDTLYAPYLNHSDNNNKTNGGGTDRIEVYRTTAGGSIFYLVAADYNPNNPFLDKLTTGGIGDDSDVSLLNNEILYTTGGVLSNIGPPASNILAASKNRIFLVPMDDPQAVWFSKEKVDRIGIEFAEELQIRIEKGGRNTGLAVMDDKILIFKEREIYFMAGEGPNDLGQGGFSPLRQISTDVGCVDPNSVVNIGKGIMFKSHKGIYIIDQSLQTTYIGAPVERWNQYHVVSANLLEDKNQVRFVLSGGQGVLVFDMHHGIWSRFTNHPAKDAVVHDGVYHWLKDDGLIRKENDEFLDVNFKIPMKVRTGWIKLNGMQGYQRVRKASVIGDYKSPHDLIVKVYYDYDDVNVGQTATFVSNAAMLGNEPLQYEIHLKNQKCQSIMFEVYDATQNGTLESCSLSSIALECAVKRGMNKKPPRKRT